MENQLEKFLEHLEAEQGFSQNTIAAYQSDLRQALGDGREPPALPEYVQQLQVAGYRESTIMRKATVVRTFLKFIDQDPPGPRAAGAKPAARKQAARLAPESIEPALLRSRMDETATGKRDSAMLHMMADTGMRASEAADLDLDAIALPRVELPRRILRVGPECERQIRRYLEEARPELLGDSPDPENLLISNRGRKLSRQWIFRTIRELLDGAGSPETLRANYAAARLDGHVPLAEVQRDMGHRNIQTTRKYLKPTLNRGRRWETGNGRLNAA